jgi:hypothetical protein
MVEDVENPEHRANNGMTSLTARQPRARKGCGIPAGTLGLIDLLTLALTHGLIALALWRMLFRADLDVDEGEAARRPWRKEAQSGTEEGPSGA